MADEIFAGRYRLIEPLGRGSMSSVWLAEDEELHRRVALKTLAPTADRARFEREARAVASLSHPNVCGLYDYGEAEGRPYMVLECLPGGTLEDRLRSGAPLPDSETDRIAGEVAAGLAQAHARGLVHRDLKPANILFDGEGRAKIADFGIARMGGEGLTETGTVLGTAAYISPEQAAGAPAGPASDVYSFGAILFRMLTGRLPFSASNAMELVRLNRDEPAPSVASVRPDAPPHLAALADAALAKDPQARPRDGAALLAAIAGADTAATVIAAPAVAEEATQLLRPAGPPPRNRSRVPALAIAALVAALLAAGGAAAWLATRSDSSSGRTDTPPAPLHLPAVPAGSTLDSTTAPTSAYTPPATTEPATSSTTQPATTEQTTTRTEPTTTAHATTEPTTTAPATTSAPPTTTAAFPTTTYATTTAPTTTAFEPTTTAPPPTTTSAGFDTTTTTP
ncbi:MAG TPA: serine/threonine-protein kinase [Gaiellaceae bacterium]